MHLENIESENPLIITYNGFFNFKSQLFTVCSFNNKRIKDFEIE